MTHRIITAVTATVILFTAASCTNNDSSTDNTAPAATVTIPDPTDTTNPTVSDLDGLENSGTWTSTNVDGRDLVPGSELTVTFWVDDDGTARISGNAGCNQLSGSYTLTDTTLNVNADMISTLRSCKGLMKQETWFANFLTSSPQLTLDHSGDPVTLTATSGDTTITFDAADTTIEGITWEALSSIRNGAATPAPAGATLILNNGTALLTTGCNNGNTTYTLTDTTITFAPVALTKKACENADSTAFEQLYLNVLSEPAAITHDPGTNTLSLTTDGTTVVFTPSS
jgi:heat shock protein HslJ